jgi:hypothetical protein
MCSLCREASCWFIACVNPAMAAHIFELAAIRIVAAGKVGRQIERLAGFLPNRHRTSTYAHNSFRFHFDSKESHTHASPFCTRDPNLAITRIDMVLTANADQTKVLNSRL